jgi:hypothetical protein
MVLMRAVPHRHSAVDQFLRHYSRAASVLQSISIKGLLSDHNRCLVNLMLFLRSLSLPLLAVVKMSTINGEMTVKCLRLNVGCIKIYYYNFLASERELFVPAFPPSSGTRLSRVFAMYHYRRVAFCLCFAIDGFTNYRLKCARNERRQLMDE